MGFQAIFVHISAKLAKRTSWRFWDEYDYTALNRHGIRALAVWGRARYISVKVGIEPAISDFPSRQL